MTEPQAVVLAKKFRDAYNDFEVDRPETLELFTDDIVYHECRFATFQGKEALKGYLQQLDESVRNRQLSWEFTKVIFQGDQVAVEWMVRSGVNLEFELPGAAFFKERDGKICYYSEYFNTAILEQLAE
jgi:ketosteroid isomerase-like protein